ncbi:MAG: crotonase/enoyl-CoA hydratase family protein [Myxococcota bacterium]
MPVHVQVNGFVTTVILDRSERRNAVDRAHADALADAFRAFDADESQRVAVLWGSGGHFCAGADLRAISEGTPNRVSTTGDAPLGPSRLQLNKPVIAAIEGFAVAGGLELAIWADLRVAASNACLGVFCRKWGVPLIDGGTVRLPRLIGHSRAMDLILTGREVPASEAFEIGLVNRLCEPGLARQTAESLAAQIAEHPQHCLRTDRASARAQWSLSEPEALHREIQNGSAVLATESVHGAAAFTQRKRASDSD